MTARVLRSPTSLPAVAVVLASALALPVAAHAATPSTSPVEPKPAPSLSTSTTPAQGGAPSADALASKGSDAYEAGQFVEAKRLFEESYKTEARAETLLKLAITEYQLHRYPSAIRHARQYAQSADAKPAEMRSMLTRFIPRCLALTAHVRFEGAARDADIVVDQEAPEQLAEEVFELMPGARRIEVHQAGRVFAFNVELAANESRTLALDSSSEERAIPAPALLAPVRLATTDGAPRPTSRARWWTVAGLGVASLGSFIAGTAFYVESENAYAKGKSLHASLPSNSACASPVRVDLVQPCADLREALTHDYPVNRDRGLGFVIAGSALAVGAVATWFLWPKRTPTTTAVSVTWIAPDVQPQGVGLRLGGAF